MSEGEGEESEVRGEYGYGIKVTHGNISVGMWLPFSCSQYRYKLVNVPRSGDIRERQIKKPYWK